VTFRIHDHNHSMTLDRHEFENAVAHWQLGLSKQDVDSLFNRFDVCGDGEIDYDEFLRVVRGPMNARRVALVDRAFDKLDKDGSGQVDFEDLVGVYNASKHPDFIAGKKTEKQVLNEWLRTFQKHHEVMYQTQADDIVTREEFHEYYNNISASVDTDQ